MMMKPVAMLSPLCLALFASNAWSAIEPFTVGASETIAHQSNINHSDDAFRVADWTSTTELNAAVNQALGRDKLIGAVAIDFNRYKREHNQDNTGYRGSLELDWSTVGNLSGAVGADASRQQYVYGTSSLLNGTTTPTFVNSRNLQTDSHEFTRLTLGGDGRWQIYGGIDLNQRRYSNEAYRPSDERQWSGNVGTRYQTTPDLSFGVQGTYVNGEYPHGRVVDDSSTKFSSRSIDATSRWQANANSELDGEIGVTSDSNDALSSGRHFINGALNYTWTPPAHFTVHAGFRRSSDADPSTGANVGVVDANNLNGTSINNVFHLEVTYALTAKVSLDATADYTQRKYGGLQITNLDGTTNANVSGSTRTSRFYLMAHYQPTRITDLSCGGGRETQHVDSRIAAYTPSYTDNYLQCSASIRFD